MREAESQRIDPRIALLVVKQEALKRSKKLLAQGREKLYAARDILIPITNRMMDGGRKTILEFIEKDQTEYVKAGQDHKKASRIIAQGKVLQAFALGKPVTIDVEDVEARAIWSIVNKTRSGQAENWYNNGTRIADQLIEESKSEQRKVVNELLTDIGAKELKPK